jgi:hypothetical protein
MIINSLKTYLVGFVLLLTLYGYGQQPPITESRIVTGYATPENNIVRYNVDYTVSGITIDSTNQEILNLIPLNQYESKRRESEDSSIFCPEISATVILFSYDHLSAIGKKILRTGGPRNETFTLE